MSTSNASVIRDQTALSYMLFTPLIGCRVTFRYILIAKLIKYLYCKQYGNVGLPVCSVKAEHNVIQGFSHVYNLLTVGMCHAINCTVSYNAIHRDIVNLECD